jgi:hypothetical protein
MTMPEASIRGASPYLEMRKTGMILAPTTTFEDGWNFDRLFTQY